MNKKYTPQINDVILIPGHVEPVVVLGTRDLRARVIHRNTYTRTEEYEHYSDSKHLALYDTWQEAVNSREFNCTHYMECMDQSLTCCKSVNQGHNYCGTCIFRNEQGE